MFRRDLIPLLLRGDFSLAEIARAVDAPPRDVEDDVRHLLRSLRRSAYRVELTPARCRKCGFEFDRSTLGKPSKCPACRSTWIREARLRLREGAEPAAP